MNKELRTAIEILLTYAKGVARDYAQGGFSEEEKEAVAILESAIGGTVNE